MKGLGIPFQRGSLDLATVEGEEHLRAKIEQVLLTEGATARSEGELPWRTNFGSGIHLLRHQNNTAALGELARVYVRDALRKWLPEVNLISVRASQQDNVLRLDVVIRVNQTSTIPVQVDIALRR